MVKTPMFAPEVQAQIRKERAEGETLETLAAKYHCGESTVHRICKGLPSLILVRLTPGQIAALQKDLKAGISFNKLARKYHCSKGWIYKFAHKLAYPVVIKEEKKTPGIVTPPPYYRGWAPAGPSSTSLLESISWHHAMSKK